MRNNSRKLFYLFAVILILSFSMFALSGCSNKSASSGGAGSTNDNLAAETVAQNTSSSSNQPGTLEAKIYWPKLPNAKLILPETKFIQFRVTGTGLTTARTAEVPYGTSTVSITNLPVGTKTAEVKAIDGNGATLTHRIVSFTITSGTTTSTDIVLGISITDNGYIPQSVKISPNDTLLFVNSGTTNHSATSDDGSTINSGTLAVGGTYPQQFTSAGVFNYHDSSPNTNTRGTITVYSPPYITSISSASGNAGDSVTITGTNFGASQGISTLTFNGIVATVTSWANTSIVCKVPSASTGNIVVIVNNQASNGYPFTINSPYISSISPGSGLVGATITIQGVNFGDSRGNSYVAIGSKQVTSYTSWLPTKIVCDVPTGASTGGLTVNVVDVPDTVTSNSVNFAVLTPAYFGYGGDGNLTLSSSFNINTDTNETGGRVVADGVNFRVTTTASLGQKNITLASTPTGLAASDEILIIKLRSNSAGGATVGKYETGYINSIDGNTLTMKNNLSNTYTVSDDAIDKVMVQRIPHYDTVTINNSGVLTASAWDGNKNGVLFIRCKTALTIGTGGQVNMAEKGFNGAVAATSFAEQYNGTVDTTGATNGGGGTGGNGNVTGGTSGGNSDDSSGGINCGGGAANNGSGGRGGGGGVKPGDQSTDSECALIYLGGGGHCGGGSGCTGGGYFNGSGGGDGNPASYTEGSGNGGGICIIYAQSVTMTGTALITARGGKGGAGGTKTSGIYYGGGAGGSGGSGGVVYIGYSSISGNTSVNIRNWGGNGGNGGNGQSIGGGAGAYYNTTTGEVVSAANGGSTSQSCGGGGGPTGNAGVTKLQSL